MVVYASQPPQSHVLNVAASPPTSPPPAEEYRPGSGSDYSYDPGLLLPDQDYTVAVTLIHLLHCPADKGTTCPCPRCQDRLASALWEGTNPSLSRRR
eukprot:6058618-Pleurochrysis_carterae.AAC.3